MEAAEGLSLCFTCGTAPISATQQQAWGLSDDDLRQRAAATATAAIDASRPLRQEVHDMPGRTFWVSNSKDGLDMAAFLHPDALAAAISPDGTAPVIGVPGAGFLIAWLPGDDELDTVMAVGIKSMHSQAASPVSDKLYRYVDGEWTVWGEARKADPF